MLRNVPTGRKPETRAIAGRSCDDRQRPHDGAQIVPTRAHLQPRCGSIPQWEVVSSRHLLLAALALVPAATACSFGGGFDGTRYQCGAGDTCPTGQACVDGYCTGGGGDDDAGVDATPLDDGGPAPDAAPPVARCGSAALFSDDFEAAGLDPARWYSWSDSGASVAETGGVVEVSFSGGGEAYAGYTSRYRHDLRDSEVRTDVTPGGGLTILEARGPGTARAQIVEENGQLQTAVLGVGGGGFRTAIPYDGGVHRYWRIREAAGTLYFEASQDSSDWTELHHEATPFDVEHVHLLLSAAGVSGDTAARFESINAGVVAPLPYCETSSLVDGFDAAPLGDGWWTWGDPSCTISETGGALAMAFTGAASEAWCGSETSHLHRLTGSAVAVEVAQSPSVEGFVTFLQLVAPGTVDTFLEIARDGGTIRFVQTIDGSQISSTSITYSATNHRHWRIRESGGRAYFETSPDGVTWTLRHDDATELDTDRMQVMVAAGHYVGISAQLVRWAGVNAP